MRNFEFLAPLVKPAATVFFTVAICVAVLFAVQPWQTQSRDEHGTSNLSANVGTPTILTTSPGPAPKSAREEQPVAAVPEPAPKPEPVPSPVITASVKKPEAVKVPPPPERLPSGETAAEDEEPEIVEEADQEETAEELETTLKEQEENPDIPALPVRAPHHKERLLKKKEKRAEQFSTPWSKAESDKALTPLLSNEISSGDLEALDKFVELAFKRKFAEALQLLEWAQQDQFWLTVILSMDSFREKFDKLTLQRERGKNHGTKPSHDWDAESRRAQETNARRLSGHVAR